MCLIFREINENSQDNDSQQLQAELHETLRRGLPRPRSGEFRALFEGNTP